MPRPSFTPEERLLEDLVAHAAGHRLASARPHLCVELLDDLLRLAAADPQPLRHLRRVKQPGLLAGHVSS